MRKNVMLLTLSLLVLGVSAVAALIPETAEARERMLDFIMAPLRPGQEVHREIIRQRTGDLVFFRTYEQTGSRYYAFMLMDEDGEMDLAAAGTWIIRRRISDGAFEQIKVFLQNDELSFLRLFPRGRTVRMDVEIAGVPLYNGVTVPMTMERALTTSIGMIRESTAGVVDWSLLDPDPFDPGYGRVLSVVERLRSQIPNLRDADDGAMDQDGNLVFIETLTRQDPPGGFNCSGFAKWVIDGFYRPRTGRLLAVEDLKQKHLDYRGTSWTASFEDRRDPFFGLDWTRNLALHVFARDRNTEPERLDPGSRDVRDISSADYIPHVGYRVRDLRHVLYRLALAEPGNIYLGSVNISFGEDVVLRQHTHVVVLMPWFDEKGRFNVAVMERNNETSMESLELRFAGEYIHLVRVAANREFDPPPMPGPD